jgi:putative sigma-54 modulation protein
VRVQVTARHCEVPDDVRARTESQVLALAKYESRATAVDVVFSDEKHARKIELLVHIDGAEPVAAHGEGGDFRAALSEGIDRVSRMLRKQHDRRRDHKAPPLSERLVAE